MRFGQRSGVHGQRARTSFGNQIAALLLWGSWPTCVQAFDQVRYLLAEWNTQSNPRFLGKKTDRGKGKDIIGKEGEPDEEITRIFAAGRACLFSYVGAANNLIPVAGTRTKRWSRGERASTLWRGVLRRAIGSLSVEFQR